MSSNHAILFYLLNEKIKRSDYENFDADENRERIESKHFDIYHRLFLTDILDSIPVNQLISNILDMFDLMEHLSTNKSIDVLDKVIKKGTNIMMREKNVGILIEFVEKLGKIQLKNSYHKKSSVIDLAFIQILEKICKIQEHSSSDNKDYLKKLNDLFEKLVNYFIDLKEKSYDAENDEASSSIMHHNFYICSILMRNICSKSFKKSENEAKKLKYFKLLLDSCLKYHKKNIKTIKNKPKTLKISSHYIDFLKSFIMNSNQLKLQIFNSEENSVEIDAGKYVKDLIRIFVKFRQNSSQIEIDFTNNTNSLSIQNELESEINQNKFIFANNYLLRVIGYSINSLSIEQFKGLLIHIQNEIVESHSQGDYVLFMKQVELIKHFSCDVELSETTLKESFFEFMQKFLVQIPPVFMVLVQRSRNEEVLNFLTTLLVYQSQIASSKYVRIVQIISNHRS